MVHMSTFRVLDLATGAAHNGPGARTMVQAREQYGHRLQRLVLTGMRCICVEESDVDTLRGFVGELLDDRL